MRAIDFISELYEPETSFPLNWYPSHDPSEASARAYDRNKGYIDIKFTPILGSDDMVEVEFSRNDSYDMTGGGDANRVLGTVLQAFREYLQGYQPKILVFSAKGASRSKVYQNLIKRFASTVGYKQFDISKLSPETQEKIAFSGSDLMVLRKSLNELNYAPAIDEAEVLDEMPSDMHEDIPRIMKRKGYKLLGSGQDAYAFLEPGTGKVLKIFGTKSTAKGLTFSPDQQMFFSWAKYCMAQSTNPFLVKFDGFEPFQYKGHNYVQIRQEKLFHINYHVFDAIDSMVDAILDDANYPLWFNYEGKEWQNELKVIKDPKLLYQTLSIIIRMGKSMGYTPDLHQDNFMQRKDGTPVIVDPWWMPEESNLEEDIKPRTYAGNVQAGNYLIKIDQHLVDRAIQRNVPQQEIINTMNKLSKAKAKLKHLAPGESFYIHDNQNGLYVLFYTLDADRKVYIARTVWPHKKKDSILPIIQVA